MKLLALDGNSIINRAFYGIRPLTTKDGQPTNAIHGFMSMLLKMLDEVEPDAVAVAFDLKAPTFRHKAYDGYKAKRKGMPEELFLQMQPLKDLLSALGYKLLTAEGFEADDILGTLAARCRELNHTCVIATGDRDSFQLIGNGVTVRMLSTKGGHPEAVTYDEAAIMEAYGVTPRQLIDIKAIQGDTSDNIPGVPGIGEKGAGELIRKFGSLDGVYENIDDPSIKPGMRTKLIEGKDSAYLSRELGRIVFTAPVELDIEEYVPAEPDVAAARAMLVRLEMFKMLERLGLADRKETIQAKKEAENAESQRILLSPDGWCDGLLQDTEVYFVYELENGALSRIAYSRRDCTVVLSSDEDISEFTEKILKNENVTKHTFDVKQLYKLCPEMKGVKMDTMLAAYLIDPEKNYGLDELLAAYTGESPADSLPNLKAAARAEKMPALSRALLAKIEENGQEKLLYDIELPLAQVLADMETAGVAVDKKGIELFGVMLSRRIAELENGIYEAVGYKFNLNSPKQLGEALFDKIGLKGGKRTKTGWSTNAEVLESLRGQHPAVDGILEYRTLSKLNSTYCAGLLKTIAPDGRIHSSFNQTETRTGRISSTEPNLQNIPVRTELGKEMRKMFVAESDEYVLVDADYSQIELRVLAHIANDENMIEAFKNGFDIHASTAAKIFSVSPENVTPEMRSASKAINFGLVYGMGEFSLAKDLHISLKSAKAYIEEYLGSYPNVKKYMANTVEFAKQHGYVLTEFNRRRDIPEINSSNRNLQALSGRIAMNTPIQGTAADIIKLAMVNVYERLKKTCKKSHLILQVHDELIVEAHVSELECVKKILKEEMENAAVLKVPLKVDMNVGKSWYDTK